MVKLLNDEFTSGRDDRCAREILARAERAVDEAEKRLTKHRLDHDKYIELFGQLEGLRLALAFVTETYGRHFKV